MLTRESFKTIEALDSAITELFWDKYNDELLNPFEYYSMIPSEYLTLDKYTSVTGGGTVRKPVLTHTTNDMAADSTVIFQDTLGGFIQTRGFEEFADGIIFNKRDIDDAKFPKIIEDVESVSVSFARHFSDELYRVFWFASSTTETAPYGIAGRPVSTYDSVALCSTAHAYKKKGNVTATGGTGFVNYMSGASSALSLTSVNTARLYMRQFKTNDAQFMARMVQPDAIIIPPELEGTAWEIFHSDGKPFEISNTNNWLKDPGFDVIVWNGLSAISTTAWFAVNKTMMKESLKWGWKDMLTAYPLEYDNYTKNYTKRIDCRYLRYIADWRWIVMSAGA